MRNSTQKNIKRYLFYPICCIVIMMSCAFNVIAFADVIPSTQVVTNQIHTEHVVWNRVPISFVVPVGAERMITFPGSVALHNSDPSLTTAKVSILNNAGTLYIKAKQAFNPIRIAVELKQSGNIVLIDLSAAQNADDSPVQVLLASNQTAENIASQKQTSPTAPVNYASLMRYAVQHLYSPSRLLEDNNAINRTPMYTTKSVNLVYGDKVIAMPLISWRGGDLYVTAVLLKNILRHRVHLSPAHLRGRWLATSFYPTNYITAKDTVHDRTTLLLISNRPFNEALNSMRGYK